jgi:hypothetical protein
MDRKGEIKINYLSAIIAAIVAIIVFCIISVIFNVMPLDALPSNFIGATLGALIGALITLVLLRGQTDIEEKKGKDIRILEKKTEVFQGFINYVWEVWKDQVITIEEFQDLTSQYYRNLMIYLKDETRLKTIGDALTAMGEKIDKTSYKDSLELRENIVAIINTLSAEIDLGGKIDTTIMDKHDKIVFPVLFRKMLLDKLNEKLKISDSSSFFKEGKYETIWEGAHHEFITFELKKYPSIKLAIGEIGATELKMVFIADRKIQELNEFRHQGYGGRFRNRIGAQVVVSNPIPDDADNTKTPFLDFSKDDSMEMFRGEKRNFPTVLANRVSYHLENWNNGTGLVGVIEFFEKYLGQGEDK